MDSKKMSEGFASMPDAKTGTRHRHLVNSQAWQGKTTRAWLRSSSAALAAAVTCSADATACMAD
jgi:hypothetical protein